MEELRHDNAICRPIFHDEVDGVAQLLVKLANDLPDGIITIDNET